jgi:hypothetical protein
MKIGKTVWVFLGSGVIYVLVCTATVSAGPVSLPFSEPFNTISADATVDYPAFTAQQAVGGAAEHWTVDAKGLRTSTVTFANLAEPAFSVTPNPKPTGEIIIQVDMGWNGQDANPPNGPGTGACGLRFGQAPPTPATGDYNGNGLVDGADYPVWRANQGTTHTLANDPIGGTIGAAQFNQWRANFGRTASISMLSESTMVFHPGYNAPPGSFRVNGPDGFPNENMGWVPQLGVLNHVEVDSFPDGTFNITVTDGSNPTNVFHESFIDPLAYGGDIGFLAAGWGSAIYKNLSITLGGSGLGSGSAVPEPARLAMFSVAGAALLLGRVGRRKLAQ